MYAKHLAWLNATPEGSKKSRRESYSEGGDGSPFLILPELDSAEYLVQYWHEAGTVGQGAAGPIALSWQEIRAWRQENQYTLSLFEIAAIRRLSDEYVGEYYSASDKSRPAPYQGVTLEDIDRTAINNKVKGIMSMFKKQDNTHKYEVEE